MEEGKKLIQFISLIILALAVSLDSFGVGITYGLKKVKIPVFSVLIIGFMSAVMILISMQIGQWISIALNPNTAKWIGAVILITIGVLALLQVVKKQDIDETELYQNAEKGTRMISIELKKIGLVIQILKTPIKADMDRSGLISPIEASFLGLALSLDAFGAGLGAALTGFKPFLTAAMIAGMSVFFILGGLRLGLWFSKTQWLQKFKVLPGFILIMIGIIKLLKYI